MTNENNLDTESFEVENEEGLVDFTFGSVSRRIPSDIASLMNGLKESYSNVQWTPAILETVYIMLINTDMDKLPTTMTKIAKYLSESSRANTELGSVEEDMLVAASILTIYCGGEKKHVYRYFEENWPEIKAGFVFEGD